MLASTFSRNRIILVCDSSSICKLLIKSIKFFQKKKKLINNCKTQYNQIQVINFFHGLKILSLFLYIYTQTYILVADRKKKIYFSLTYLCLALWFTLSKLCARQLLRIFKFFSMLAETWRPLARTPRHATITVVRDRKLRSLYILVYISWANLWSVSSAYIYLCMSVQLQVYLNSPISRQLVLHGYGRVAHATTCDFISACLCTHTII